MWRLAIGRHEHLLSAKLLKALALHHPQRTQKRHRTRIGDLSHGDNRRTMRDVSLSPEKDWRARFSSHSLPPHLWHELVRQLDVTGAMRADMDQTDQVARRRVLHGEHSRPGRRGVAATRFAMPSIVVSLMSRSSAIEAEPVRSADPDESLQRGPHDHLCGVRDDVVVEVDALEPRRDLGG